MVKIINLLQWQPGYSGFGSYIKRVLPHIDGLRIQVNSEGLIDLLEPSAWSTSPPPIAQNLIHRVLQRTSFLQYGVNFENILKLYNHDIKDIDVIYSPFLDPIVQLRNTPQVITCPDFIPFIYRESKRSYYRTKIFYPLYFSLATKLITYSQHVADQLVEQEVANEKITIVPCGIDVCRQRLNRPKSDDVVIIARHDKHKNLKFLLLALKRFKYQNSSWKGKINIVGKRGRMTKELKKLVNTFPYPNEINFIENIHSTSLIQLLRNSFVLISASCEEGFDYPILEAKAEGIPTLISDIRVHREFHSESSLFFSLLDSTDSFCDVFKDLLIDDSIWNELSLKGYALAKSMTIDNQVSQISSLINEIS